MTWSLAFFGAQAKYEVDAEFCMKLRLFLGGLLVGVAIGIMVGGAVVKIPADQPGKRQYPQGVALLLAILGGTAAGSALRGLAAPAPGPK